jgi:hypothetical protein
VGSPVNCRVFETLEGFVALTILLHEPGAAPLRIGQYVRRWLRWVNGGLARKSVAFGVATRNELSVLVCPPFVAARRHPPHRSPLLTSTTR